MEQPEKPRALVEAPSDVPRRATRILVGCLVVGLALCAAGYSAAAAYLSIVQLVARGASVRSTQAQASQEALTRTQEAQSRQATVEAASAWPVVLQDSFDSDRNLWMTGRVEDDDGEINRYLAGGTYHWRVTANRDFMETAFLNADAGSESYVAVTVRRVSGQGDSSAGLLFGVSDGWYGRFYFFAMSTNGQFGLWYWEAPDWQELIRWSSSQVVSTTGDNRLEVVTEADWIHLRINGEEVAEIADSRQRGGTVGLGVELFAAGDQVEFEFDDFELRAP